MTDRVQLAFVTLLGRAAEPTGLRFWQSAAATLSDAALFDAIAASPEYRNAHAGEDLDTQLAALHRRAFGRDADADLPTLDGTATFGERALALLEQASAADTRVLDSKLAAATALSAALGDLADAGLIGGDDCGPVGELVAAIGAAGDWQTGVADAVGAVQTSLAVRMTLEVQALYLGFFGRPADPAGLEFWREVLRAHDGDLDALARHFADAAAEEFAATHGDATPEDVVTALYRDLAGRAPDAEGFAFWLGALRTDLPAPLAQGELAVQFLAAMREAPGVDMHIAAGRAAVAQAVTDALTELAADPARLAALHGADMAPAQALLAAVGGDAATLAWGHDQAEAVAREILRQAGIPVRATDAGTIPPPTTPPITPGKPGDDAGTPAPVDPTTHLYVDAAATDGTTFARIQDAIDAAPADGPTVIHIAAGTYAENLRLRSDITLLGGEGVLVESLPGYEAAIYGRDLSNVVLQDLAVQRGAGNGMDYNIALYASDGVTLTRVTVPQMLLRDVTGATLDDVVARVVAAGHSSVDVRDEITDIVPTPAADTTYLTLSGDFTELAPARAGGKGYFTVDAPALRQITLTDDDFIAIDGDMPALETITVAGRGTYRLDAGSAEQAVALDIDGSAHVTYFAGAHGDTVSLQVANQHFILLGKGADTLRYAGDASGDFGLRVARSELMDFDRIADFGADDRILVASQETLSFQSLVMTTSELGLLGARRDFPVFDDANAVFVRSAPDAQTGMLLVDVDGNGVLTSEADFFVRVDLQAGVEFTAANVAFF